MTERDFLLDVLKGNESAVEFCLLLGAISQSWDDLIDGDKEVAVNRMMVQALVDLPCNQFYRSYFDFLQPIIQSCIIDWLSSNVLEQGSVHDKTISFVLRDSLTAVFIQCASIVGGMPWAIAQAPRIRRAFHDEKIIPYLRGLKK